MNEKPVIIYSPSYGFRGQCLCIRRMLLFLSL